MNIERAGLYIANLSDQSLTNAYIEGLLRKNGTAPWDEADAVILGLVVEELESRRLISDIP